MKALVFIPGIMGSELRNKESGDKVWPPGLIDIITKKADVDALLEPNLEATRPISAVAGFYSVYRSLLRDIEACGYQMNGVEKRFISFAYDWRQSNEITAQKLSERLSQETDIDEFVFLGHSMGGLIARFCMESGQFDDRSWFSKVSQVITLGTPHNGAPAALQQVAGLDANLGLSAENIKRLASDNRYPSAYQLVPPSGASMVLHQTKRNQVPSAIDAFDKEIIEQFSLNATNIESANNFWEQLDISKRPGSVSYFSFVGSAQKTLYRLDWNGRELLPQESRDSGDGTVPTASCLDVSIPHAFSQKKHASVFADRNVRMQLYKMLGADSGVQPHSASGQVDIQSTTAMGMSTDREEYASSDTMEIAVSYAMAQNNPRCHFQISQLLIPPLNDDSSDAINPENTRPMGEPMSVRFEGMNVREFKFNVKVDLPTGFYELQASAEMDDPERTFFMVTEDAEKKGER